MTVVVDEDLPFTVILEGFGTAYCDDIEAVPICIRELRRDDRRDGMVKKKRALVLYGGECVMVVQATQHV
jgi:hypothetical protein